MKVEPTKFIAMWDITGLECLINVTKHEAELEAFEKKKMWNTLKDLKLIELKPKLPIQEMIIRARYNSQRHYEIYGFTSYESEEWVKDTFESNPQQIVDWIRENGSKIYSDKVDLKDVVIV